MARKQIKWGVCPDCGGYSSEGHTGTERCSAYKKAPIDDHASALVRIAELTARNEELLAALRTLRSTPNHPLSQEKADAAIANATK